MSDPLDLSPLTALFSGGGVSEVSASHSPHQTEEQGLVSMWPATCNQHTPQYTMLACLFILLSVCLFVCLLFNAQG